MKTSPTSTKRQNAQKVLFSSLGLGSLLLIQHKEHGNMFAQVQGVVKARGRYGSTSIKVVELHSAQIHTFSWKDKGLLGINIADANELFRKSL